MITGNEVLSELVLRLFSNDYSTLGGFVLTGWGFFQSDGNFNFKGGINI